VGDRLAKLGVAQESLDGDAPGGEDESMVGNGHLMGVLAEIT
jgi:hypothetical protein